MLQKQGQHRISQVYLKQFAFRHPKTKAYVISVYERGNPITSYKSIKSFTKETNLFDTPLADPGFERYFENSSKKVETNYPKVLRSIDQTGELDKFCREQLIAFVSNLFLSQGTTRELFLTPILESKQIRAKLFNEITMFYDEPELHKLVLEEIADDKQHSTSHKLNLIKAQIWGHLSIVLKQLSLVILRARPETGWFTSDNPVIIDTRDNIEAWIVPPQAEIYFPLSPEYLLFIHNHRVNTDNPIKNFEPNKVTDAPMEIMDSIMRTKIGLSANRFAICCSDLGIVDLRK
ncbi:MAG: DUF4238 domain-containing protein [Cyclobacteriaceae bacterium]